LAQDSLALLRLVFRRESQAHKWANALAVQACARSIEHSLLPRLMSKDSQYGGSQSRSHGANGCSQSLADFKQLSLLGEGAYSAVYKVLRLADREIYALKKVKLPSLSDKEKQNALNEVRLLASMRHDNLISFKEAFFDEKTRCLCIVMEFSDCGDLFQMITKCQKERVHPKEADVWRYLQGMCHGLKALHDMRILHRDLKCANVFLSTIGNESIAKLGDFNVSKVAKRGLCMTQTGTPYYASPEVWRDMPYDAKSDMWSLGCVLYEMVALRPPFRAEDMEGLYRKVLRGQYPRIPAHFSNDLSEIIGILLQVNPRHRPSIDQMLELPVMRRHQANAAPEHRIADLLNTIKLPKNAIDISGCLPEARYEINQIPEIPPSQESAGDIAGGTAKAPPRGGHSLGGRGQGPSLLPNRSSDEGDSSKLDLDSYQDSLDAYLSPPPPQQRGGPSVPPVHHQPPSVAPQHHQPPSVGHLPNINQSHAGGDSLDTYVQRQQVQRQPQRRQQQLPGSEYGDHGAEESQQRLPRHASPAPSGQASRAPMPIYSQQPAHAQQQAYGQQQYRQPRGNNERRPMASYARQQYALGPGGSQAGSQAGSHAVAPPRQPTGGGGGLRLPRIFSKAS